MASSPIHTLAIDIGGTGIKMLVLDGAGQPLNERSRKLTPHPATPYAVLGVIAEMLTSQPPYERASVGFPGVVVQGITKNAPNLGSEMWRDIDVTSELRALTNTPVRVINDADLQGYGVIDGQGVELVLTLGTGLGSALFIDGRLVPNLELSEQQFREGQTLEDRIADSELKRIGPDVWSAQVIELLHQLQIVFNPERIHLGGGNLSTLNLPLPANVRSFTNTQGMTGALQLWND